MAITTVTSRQLNQDLARAKRAARTGPVFITDRGRPALVLLSIDDYRRLSGKRRNLLDSLSMEGLAGIALEPAAADVATRPADLL